VNDHATGRNRPSADPGQPGREATPIAAILAGGAGRRLGGDKAIVELQGVPLIRYPLKSAQAVLDEVVVVAKADTRLPPLPGVVVWLEPERPAHPVIGITQALALAERRAVLVCAGDLPFVTPALLRRIVRADPGRAPAVVACVRGAMMPLLGCYQPSALDLLAPAARGTSAPLRETVAAIEPVLLEVDDPEELFDVNTPDDLLMAAAMLDRQRSRQRGRRVPR
jgi:molybdenum cofactor guanylyltransferase